MLSDVYTTSQFVDTALDSGTDTQLILVKKQVNLRLAELLILFAGVRIFKNKHFLSRHSLTVRYMQFSFRSKTAYN
jgi:hypothetical protein